VQIAQHKIKRGGLSSGSWKTVKDIPMIGRQRGHTLLHKRNHDIIPNQLAALDGSLRR
jgi:hypothetical protein